VLTRPGRDPDAALVSIDPKTGFVRAMVGGYNYWGGHDYAQVNLAMGQGRPTGSSFKGITLATALAKGFTPEDTFPSPQTIRFPGNPPWQPSGGGGLGGSATLRQCAEKSSNTCFAYLSVKVLGPETIREMAYRLGVTEGTLKDADGKTYGPITLGPYNTTVLDMASVYATFANRGVRVPPVFVTKITRPDGSIVYQHQHEQEKVLEPEIAYQVSDILRGVILRGTGKQNGQIGRDAAGKTGTVEVKNNKANTDIWFCGYTPDLATAVWVGYAEPLKDDAGNPIRLRDLGNRQGGDEPTLIWARYMREALAPVPPNVFSPPPARTQFEESTPEIKEFEKIEPPTYVQMPDVRKMTAEQATKLIRERGLNPDIRLSPTQSGESPGTVKAQSPAPGYTLSVGTLVTVEITEGTPIESIPMSSLLGTPLAEAQQFLLSSGYTVESIPSDAPVGAVRPDGSPLLQGDVWGQTPEPGQPASDGTVQLFYQP
jgi:membrane peptidoglycan carboxypeptidase